MNPIHHASGGIDTWIIILIIGLAVVFLSILIWLISRKTISSDGLKPAERKILTSEQKEILSMVRQKGRPITQIEIVDMTSGGPEYVIEILKEMEEKGLIKRTWNSEKNTYLISPS
jgi:DNA-binding MarR family transcriptional regulator